MLSAAKSDLPCTSPRLDTTGADVFNQPRHEADRATLALPAYIVPSYPSYGRAHGPLGR